MDNKGLITRTTLACHFASFGSTKVSIVRKIDIVCTHTHSVTYAPVMLHVCREVGG